jgi:hypothetical protein
MIRNKFNKKTVNSLILGSFLLGSSANIITQVQATSTSPQKGQKIHQYDKQATAELNALRSKLVPVEKWIQVVDRENGADPNVQIGTLGPLEEAILRGNPKAVEILIQKGADVNKIVKPQEIKDRYGNKSWKHGRTLLHLSVYTPEKMHRLWEVHVGYMHPSNE